jgi:hypothetical protein
MGTRADFYVGRGVKARWVGSIAWDGYPGSRTRRLLKAADRLAFLAAVKELSNEHDFSEPKRDGWPWPWEDSCTTDFAYAWHRGAVWVSCHGSEWLIAKQVLRKNVEFSADCTAVFPQMMIDEAAPYGSKRSGGMLASAAAKCW